MYLITTSQKPVFKNRAQGSTQPLKKMSTRDSPGGKVGRCVRLTTYHPCSAERQEIRGLNQTGPPWAISTACCGRDLYFYLYLYLYQCNRSMVLLVITYINTKHVSVWDPITHLE